ncbi:MAG: hypothetical protein JNL50_12075 [Phycisphaerae bacterium]|nr:hypothetical protein [Phycisphaerae bacterium]
MSSETRRVCRLIPLCIALAGAGCASREAAPEPRSESTTPGQAGSTPSSVAHASTTTAWTLAPVRSGGFSIAMQRVEVRRSISFAASPNHPEGWSLQSTLSIGEPSAGVLFRPRGYVRLTRMLGDDGRDYLPAPVPAGLNPARVFEMAFKASGDASGGVLHDQRDWHHSIDFFVRTAGLPCVLRSLAGELVVDVVEEIAWREVSLEAGQANEVVPGLTLEMPTQPQGRTQRTQLSIRVRRDAPLPVDSTGAPVLPYVNAVEEWRDSRWRPLQIGTLSPSADKSELGTIVNLAPVQGAQRFRAQIITTTREARLPFEFVNVPILATEHMR